MDAHFTASRLERDRNMESALQEKTRRHYDKYHFIEGGSKRIAWWREYLSEFLPGQEIQDRLILDVGSSIGEISRGLLDRGARLVCLDVSFQSLSRCRETNPEANSIQGTALRLPFPNGSFDHAISIGVLHHTPDCRRGFRELARVTAPGGTVLVFLYNYWNPYNVIYHAFKPVRALVPLDRVPRPALALLQPFVIAHLGQKLDHEELRNLLGDKLWTPQATFHSISEVRRWASEEGLVFVRSKKFFLGYANVMQFKKAGESGPFIRRKLILACANCSFAPMQQRELQCVCPRCSLAYDVENGIVKCPTQLSNREELAAAFHS